VEYWGGLFGGNILKGAINNEDAEHIFSPKNVMSGVDAVTKKPVKYMFFQKKLQKMHYPAGEANLQTYNLAKQTGCKQIDFDTWFYKRFSISFGLGISFSEVRPDYHPSFTIVDTFSNHFQAMVLNHPRQREYKRNLPDDIYKNFGIPESTYPIILNLKHLEWRL